MRIKKIHIIKYGPINGLDLDIGPGLQVIKGRNEAGKTLTIEAVTKMLLEGKIRDFDDIDRVVEEPEGYVLFEDLNGKEQKVNIKSGLANHMDLGGLDLRNIFIIRDSDLTLRDEFGYYKNITDKLSGLQLDKIDRLMSSIQDFGRLVNPSSDSKLSNSMEHGKIATLRSKAASFEQESRDYLGSSEKERLDYLELEQISCRYEMNRLRESIKTAEETNEWENFRKRISGLDQLKKHWNTYIEYRDFSHANYEKIYDQFSSFNKIKGKISRDVAALETNVKQKEVQEEKLTKVQGKLDILEEKKREIDRLRSNLEIFNRRKAEEVKEPERFSRIITVILLLLAPLSFPAVYVPTQNLLYAFILPVLLLIAGIVIFVINRAGIKKDRFAADGKLLENDFKKIGFKIKNLDDVFLEMSGFEDGYLEIRGERDALRDKRRLMEMEEKRMTGDLDDDARDKESLEMGLEEIKGSLAIGNIRDFNEKSKIKNRAGSEILAIAKTFKDIPDEKPGGFDFDMDPDEISDGMDSMIRSWQEKIAESKPDGKPPAESEIVPSRHIEGLRLKLEGLEKKEGTLNIRLEDHRKVLNDFQRRFAAMDLSRGMDNFHESSISSLDRLNEAADRVKDFIELIDLQYSMAVEAIKIFESIKNTEETKVSELFKKLEMSSIFKDITEGKYIDVRFDSQAREVMVVDQYEKELPAENLSKGAYDQLFLAIRIAISKEILGGGNGFFILDDAFLSSDSGRLVRQFKVLKRLADNGWSIIYFSVKDEVVQLSAKFSKNKIIEIK